MNRRAKPRTFRALLEAVECIEQNRPDALPAALERVAWRDFLRTTARHRCVGYIYRALLEFKIRTPQARNFLEAAREYRARAALQAFATRKQLSRLIAMLDRASVPFALLKGAARLFRNNIESEWHTMSDLDVLIPRAAAAHAVSVLEANGYKPYSGGFDASHYALNHHHLIPLVPTEPGLSVELHVELAPPGTLSIETDWLACEPYFQPVASERARVRCLDDMGTALHLMLHASGVHRLHDVVMLAQILKTRPDFYAELTRIIGDEKLQAVELQAALNLSARLAGLDVQCDSAIQRYLNWIQRREDLPRYVRSRSQFADAWYGNGGRLIGPATRRALPKYAEPNKVIATLPFLYAFRCVNRIVVSAYATLVCR